MVIERFVLLGLLLTLLAACATTSNRSGEADDVNCLYMRKIREKHPIDERHFYVRSMDGPDFLLTLADPCPAFMSKKIGFAGFFFSLGYGLRCSDNFPDVIRRVDYSGIEFRCPVSRVERIDSEEAGEAIAKRRSAVYKLAYDFADAWNAGEAADIAAMFTDSASLSIDEADSVEGREAIEAAIGRLMATTPELHVAQSDIDDEAESITLSWSWSEAIPQRDDDPVIAGRQVWQLSADAEIESATIRTRAERGD